MSVGIRSIGTALPERSIEQEDALAHALVVGGAAVDPERLGRFYRRSGVRRRHGVVIDSPADGVRGSTFFPPARNAGDRGPTTGERMRQYARHAAGLAQPAASRALAEAGLAPADVTHLVTVSCTGFQAPGPDLELMDRLGIAPTAARTHIGYMGCHAALNALRVAKAFAAADLEAHVLVCAVELCSLHFQYGGEPDRMVANALFADGAAAAVVDARTDVPPLWRLDACGSTVVPDTTDAMRWTIGDHGFEMTLAPTVPRLIETTLRPWLDRWLDRQGLTVADVAHWAVHPGGPRILSACGRTCGLSEAQLGPSTQLLAECGNMSSPTVLFLLDRLSRQAAEGPCVALAFGPGLTIEAALLHGAGERRASGPNGIPG